MTDEFTNRFGSFETALGVLMLDAYKALWFNVPPIIFTTKVAAAQQAVVNLEAYCTEQGIDIRGVALDKEAEQGQLEDTGCGTKRCKRRRPWCATWLTDS